MLYPYYCFVSHLTSILRGHQLVLSQAHYNQRVPFHSQNNHSPHHTCPKASQVLVLPGCGKSHLHGSVGRQMRDCTPGWLLGAFSKVSGIVSPDVALLTTVKRRLVVSVFDMGTWHGETLTLVSPPSFYMILFKRDAIFTRSYLWNPTWDFSWCFQYTLNQCSVSQRLLWPPIFTKVTVATSCISVSFIPSHQSLPSFSGHVSLSPYT